MLSTHWSSNLSKDSKKNIKESFYYIKYYELLTSIKWASSPYYQKAKYKLESIIFDSTSLVSLRWLDIFINSMSSFISDDDNNELTRQNKHWDDGSHRAVRRHLQQCKRKIIFSNERCSFTAEYKFNQYIYLLKDLLSEPDIWWLLLFSVHILISHSTNVTSNSRSLWLFPKAIPANYHRVELPSFVPFISFIPGPPQHTPKLKREIFSFSGITISVPLGQRRVSWLWWCWAGCAWRRGSTSRQGRSLGESGHSNWRNFLISRPLVFERLIVGALTGWRPWCSWRRRCCKCSRRLESPRQSVFGPSSLRCKPWCPREGRSAPLHQCSFCKHSCIF